MPTIRRAAEPFWLPDARPDLLPDGLPDGVRVLLKPLGTSGLAAGRASAFLAADELPAVASVAFTVGCLTWGVVAWEGFEDEDGAALPVEVEAIQAMLEQSPDIYAALDAAYVTPRLLQEIEKKGLWPALAGTSPASPETTLETEAPGAASSSAPPAQAAATAVPTI